MYVITDFNRTKILSHTCLCKITRFRVVLVYIVKKGQYFLSLLEMFPNFRKLSINVKIRKCKIFVNDYK